MFTNSDENSLLSCIVCLVSDNLVSTNDFDSDNIQWKGKLTFCIPELDWNIGYYLCQLCTTQLNILCNFRNQCLRSHLKCKTDNFIHCKNCMITFSCHNDLIEHNKVVHCLDKPYICLLCLECFETSQELVVHEKEHYQITQFHCESCNIFYNNEAAFETHKLYKHTDVSLWDNCEHCAIKFPTNETLNAHMQLQHGSEIFICFHCNQSYLSKDLLIEHINQKHAIETSFMCHTNDGAVFNTKLKLEAHQINCNCNDVNDNDDSSEGEKPEIKRRGRKPKIKVFSSCELCGITFSTKYLLNRHVRNVHAAQKNYTCDICAQKFASPVYLAAHKKYHSGNRPHICSFCGKGYITASDLYHHEKIHANKRAYKCEKCPKAFNTSSDLHKHRICVHIDRAQWKYVCTYCDRRFPLKTNLDTHTKTHTGEKNFACHLCERRCINRSVLQRHIESHSNVRLFKCSHCELDYKHQKSLDIHLKKVHGIGDAKIPERVKKYFCHVCPKSYFANNKLQKHIRTHTGERPFACHMCDKRFIDKSYMKQHLKTTHNVFEPTVSV